MGIRGEGEVGRGRPGGRVELGAKLELCLAQCERDLPAGGPQGLGTSQLTGPPPCPLMASASQELSVGYGGSLGSRKFPSPSEANPQWPQDVCVMGVGVGSSW